MKEYKVFKIKEHASDTEMYLNQLARSGWRLICSYALNNNWLIVERELKYE